MIGAYGHSQAVICPAAARGLKNVPVSVVTKFSQSAANMSMFKLFKSTPRELPPPSIGCKQYIAVIAVGMFASVADAKPHITGGNLPPLEKPRITGGNSPPVLLPTKQPHMVECKAVQRILNRRC